MIGFDTGFFLRLLDGDARAVEVWTPVADGETPAAVSCISFFELDRLALKGRLDRQAVEVLTAELPRLCRVCWLGEREGHSRLTRAARLAHGTGLPMADALILAALLEAAAEQVYTTDTDFTCYDGDVEIVVL